MVEVEKVLFKVDGMVKRGSITWTGWPDGIVSTLEGVEGILRIVYLADEEAFELSYIPSVVSLEKIFEKVKALGNERNLPYKSVAIPGNEIKCCDWAEGVNTYS